jgi:phosphopantetheine adenylyltransferase
VEEQSVFFRKTETYRIIIDAHGVGHIRIIKRMNFRTILNLFKELYLEIRKDPTKKPHIVIHLSQSLCDEMSDNLREFLLFCSTCLDGKFELAVVE